MKKLLYVLSIISLFLTGCEKEAVLEKTSFVELEKNVFNIGPEGGDVKVKVTSSEDWSVAGISDWVSTVTLSGKSGEYVVFHADPNDSASDKSAEFKVFAGSATETLAIHMVAESFLTLESEELEISSDAVPFSVRISTNVDDVVMDLPSDAGEWLTFVEKRDLFGKTAFMFEAARSSEFKDRQADIRFSADGKAASFRIVQAQRDTVIGKELYQFDGLGAGSLELILQSNVDLVSTDVPSWLVESRADKGTERPDGLYEWNFEYTFGETDKTRFTHLEYLIQSDEEEGATIFSTMIKQQNPDARFVTIPNAGMRPALTEMGWVIETPGSDQCEILPVGDTSDVMVFSGNVEEVSSLGVFPKLQMLTLNSGSVVSANLTDCAILDSVNVMNTSAISEIKLPDSVKSLIFNNKQNSYMQAASFKVIGKNVEILDLGSTSFYVGFWEKCTSIDISACPNVKKLNVVRKSPYSNNIKLATVYVSAAQKTAIDSGLISVSKLPATQITVR